MKLPFKKFESIIVILLEYAYNALFYFIEIILLKLLVTIVKLENYAST